MSRRFCRLGVVSVAFALVVLASSSPLFGGQPPGQPHAPEAGSGVASLDVYAQRSTIDMVTTVRDGHAMELRHIRSVDGGETWGGEHVIDVRDKPISIARRGNEPQVVAHGDHVVVHWSTAGESRHGGGPMATAVSHDAGETWTPGPNPTNDDTKGEQNFADMTADPAGTFYVAWIGDHAQGPAGRALGVARSTDFGETWGLSQLIDPTSCACCWNKMIAPQPGMVHVLYRDHEVRDMALATTTDAGESWALRSPVGAFDWVFPGCPHVGGGIAMTEQGGAEQLHGLVWTGHEERHGLYRVRSTNDGDSWSEPRRVGGELARHADLGAAGSYLLAAWDEERGIWVSSSRDAGETWDEPRRLSTQDAVASHPIVVHAGDGFVVFWTERGAGRRLDWQSHRLTHASSDEG